MPPGEDLYADYLKRFQSAPKENLVTGLRSLFGGQETQGDVLREVTKMSPILNLGMANEREKRAQETESRKAQTEQSKQLMEIYKALHEDIKSWHGLPEDVKTAQRPSKIKTLTVFGKAIGYDQTDAEALTQFPEYADKMLATTDPSMRQELRDALRDQLASVPPGPTAADQRGKIRDQFVALHEQEAVDTARQALSLIPQRFAGRKDVTPQEVQALVAKEFPALSQSPAYRKAWATLMKDNELLASLGIQSPAATLEGQKKGATVKAEAAAKFDTPQGRAEFKKLLAEIDNAEAQGDQTRAQTAKTKLDTALATIKTIPAAGGALVDVSGAIGQGGAVAQSPAAGEGGATGAPGVRVISQTPGPPATSEVVKDVVRGEKIEQALTRIQNLQNDATLKQYVGPKTSRPVGAFVQAWQQNAPGGKLPDNFVRLQQSAGELKNFLIQEITGAAVRPDEEPRIMAEAPDITADKWDAFWQKYKQTLETVKIVNRRKKELYGPDGRLKVGADPDAVAKRHPLPKAADTKPGKPGSPFQPVTR